ISYGRAYSMWVCRLKMERRKRRSPIDEYVDSFMDSPEKLQRCTQFYQSLRSYYRRKWNCPLKSPYIQGVELNLSRLYCTVVSFGGWQKVSQSEKWGDVAQAIGVSEGVAVAEHAVKVLYMRYLSKYEQSELVGDVDDSDADLLGSRGRGKGFSSLATADCPVSVASRQTNDFFRVRPEKKTEAEYERLVKSLLCGLPNEVDFAVNVCTLLSHPGPRVLRLSAAPQLITLLVAHVAVFADGDNSLYGLYESWSKTSGHDFTAFWRGAGIEDEEILALLPNVSRSEMPKEDLELFTGLEAEFRPRDPVSWRVQQILSIMRNLSFEVINKPIMAASWPLLKFLFVCSNCKWSALRTAALDALSNIASEIDLMCEESSVTNHLLLKTVSRCLNSSDKLQVIRSLEILAGLCNNEHNESLLCEFLDSRILSKIFDVITVKDIMMCVYTLEALYQISELGASACQQVSLYPRAIDTLVDLATVEAVSFGPSGLVGMKVVEFHGPPQLAPPPPQNLPPTSYTTHTPRPGAFAAPAPPGTYQSSSRALIHSSAIRSAPATATQQNSTNTATVGESKVEQLTAKWLRLNCLLEMGNITPRGELYACYVDDLRNHYNALSGSVQMFTNILKSIFPQAVVRVGTNSSSMVIENVKLSKGHGVGTIGTIATTATTATASSSTGMVAAHPLVQKMLSDGTQSASLNGHMSSPTAQSSEVNASGSDSPVSNISEEASRPSASRSSANDSSNNTSSGAFLPGPNKVCRAAVEARDFIPDDGRHEAKIVRVENTCRVLPQAAASPQAVIASQAPLLVASKGQHTVAETTQLKSAVARRLNGIVEEKAMNGDTKTNGCETAATQQALHNNRALNGMTAVQNGEVATDTASTSAAADSALQNGGIREVAASTSGTSTTRDEDSESRCSSSSSAVHSPAVVKRRRTSACPTPKPNDSHAERGNPSTSADCGGDYLCEWNGCGRYFKVASSMLYHCTLEHVGNEESIQCHWPRCDSTVRAKWSMVTHLQDHHCNEAALQAAAKRRREGLGVPLGPVNPERPRDAQQHPGYSKNAAVEAIRRHAFNYLPRDITDDPEGPVTKSIRLTSCLILRNLARYSNDGRRLIRRHERLLCWLSLSRVESSSALAQLLAELYPQQPSS
uniref:ARID domain-containing protein n=2 Tax=Parascaris univalens TaxID=6257 RepID=A0A915AX55_PARUN